MTEAGVAEIPSRLVDALNVSARALFGMTIAIVAFLGGAIAACPPHSHVANINNVGETMQVSCRCDAGYENQSGACVLQTIMRPIDRRDCFTFAGNHIQEAARHCNAPLLSCIADVGFTKDDAACLVAALGLQASTELPVIEAAAGACGIASIDKISAVGECRNKWKYDKCLDDALKRHAKEVADCRAMK